jgi:hypothetical protein
MLQIAGNCATPDPAMHVELGQLYDFGALVYSAIRHGAAPISGQTLKRIPSYQRLKHSGVCDKKCRRTRLGDKNRHGIFPGPAPHLIYKSFIYSYLYRETQNGTVFVPILSG